MDADSEDFGFISGNVDFFYTGGIALGLRSFVVVDYYIFGFGGNNGAPVLDGLTYSDLVYPPRFDVLFCSKFDIAS